MSTIDEVRERLSIEQVVGEVVALKRAGSTYKGLCPFHQEKTPSFIVTPSRGTYKCFGCAKTGDIFTFVMETKHVDFREALHELAAKAGVTIEGPQQAGAADALKARIFEMNAAAAIFFQATLQGAAGERARAYLQRRAISAATVERFGLGYAPGDGLRAHLHTAGYTDDDLVAAGLAIAPEEGGPIRDRFRGRLIFPIRDEKGRILGFGGRLLGDGEPKYLNSPATSAFDKSRVLYTIEHARDAMRGRREGVLVEGYVDALRAHQEGFPNVVATLGTAITEQQLRALARLAPRLVLALDADPAGQKAAVRAGLAALSALPRRQGEERVQVYVATLPEGQDPDETIAADPETWRRAVSEAVPLMDHYFALVEAGLDRTQPTWRQEAIDTLTPAIGQLDGLGVQQAYIERLSELTGVDARYLRAVTPGGLPQTSTDRRDARRRGATAPPPPPHTPQGAPPDPIRVTEEYLVGLLLLHRPLAPAVRAEISAYSFRSDDLVPLVAALLAGEETAPDLEDLADRLATAAGQQPAVPPHDLLARVRLCIVRASEERTRRELQELSRLLQEVDRDTAREMNDRTLETMTLKEQLTLRLDKEHAQQHRRQPAEAGDGTGEVA